MSDENLKPLSFDDEEVLKPISFDTSNNTPTDFVPLANANTNEIKNKDSNFVFFFGVSIVLFYWLVKIFTYKL